jgi:hypothetical protein
LEVIFSRNGNVNIFSRPVIFFVAVNEALLWSLFATVNPRQANEFDPNAKDIDTEVPFFDTLKWHSGKFSCPEIM